MTENQENVNPQDEVPDPVVAKTREIVLEIMNAGLWGTVSGSKIVPQGNNMWEFRIHFVNNSTRRVRIGGNGTVTSDTTGPTNPLGKIN